MQRTFTVNGKTYTARPFDFNTVCDLEDSGVSLANIKDKPMSAVRAYFTLCYPGDKETAGKEIENHLIGGGDMVGIIEAMNKEMEESDFFQALSKKEDKESPKEKREKSTQA